MAAAHTVHVQVEEAFGGQVRPRQIRTAARAALDHQGTPAPAELTVRITGDGELRRLNRDFLGHDRATDVLSFPAEKSAGRGKKKPAAEPGYLGDIAIAFPRAHAQAEAGGHSVDAEIQLLTVHGVLHLLGHDHATPKEKKAMWAAQAEILSAIGSPIAGPVESEA